MFKDRWTQWIIIFCLWAIVVALIYPLIILKNVNTINATEYMYRTILAIIIMIILFGKNAFDLFIPQAYSKKAPKINVILMVFYSVVLGAGIIFMIARLLTLYFRALGSEIELN